MANASGRLSANWVDDGAHHDGHRPGRAGNLSAGAAKHRSKKPDRDGAIQSGNRPDPRGDAECERQRQRDNRRCQTAIDIAHQGFGI